jgi:DNA-binding GntR family transcriptional regulator
MMERMRERIAPSQLKYRTAPEVVADYLRDAIYRNELLPGQQLQQEELAAKFGVSRIPVRDALRQLQAEGLVDLFPNRGAFVSNPGVDELREVFGLRILLEAHALRQAVPNFTRDDLELCSSLLARLESIVNRADWSRTDQEFHAALYAPCRQPKTLALIDQLRGSVNRFYFLYLSPESYGEDSLKEHRQILRACQRRDADAAVKALEKHLRGALKEVEEVTASQRLT